MRDTAVTLSSSILGTQARRNNFYVATITTSNNDGKTLLVFVATTTHRALVINTLKVQVLCIAKSAVDVRRHA